jgi:predicted nucleic acid-binding protein
MNLCVDTGYIYALYDRREIERHEVASDIFTRFIDPGRSNHKIIFVWPVLYEALSTRFVRKSLLDFSRDLIALDRKGRIDYLDDKPYRDRCFNDAINFSDDFRCLSLVDRVIREALFDSDLKVDCLLTFNPGDFADVCRRRHLRLLCQEILK